MAQKLPKQLRHDVEFLTGNPNGADSFYGIPGIRHERLPGVDDKECVKHISDCPDPNDPNPFTPPEVAFLRELKGTLLGRRQF